MRWIFEHFWLKVLAVITAAVFWLAVSSERSERVLEKAYDVPIVFGAVPQHLIVTSTPYDTVRVRLRARESLLSTVSSQTLEATVDLSESRAGEISAILRPQALNLPAGIDVVSINPAKIIFTLEQKRQKVVPIRPFITGEPDAGLRVASVVSDPQNALISGPASLVRDINEVVTERVLLGSRARSFTAVVGVVSDRALVRVLEPVNARVNIELEPVEVPTDTTVSAAPATSMSTSLEGPASTSPADSGRIARPGEPSKHETTVRH